MCSGTLFIVLEHTIPFWKGPEHSTPFKLAIEYSCDRYIDSF